MNLRRTQARMFPCFHPCPWTVPANSPRSRRAALRNLRPLVVDPVAASMKLDARSGKRLSTRLTRHYTITLNACLSIPCGQK